MPAAQKRTKSAQLAAIACVAGCEREPFYVRRPITPGLERVFPVEGWYWAPRGATEAEFLAGTFADAYHRLRCIIEEQTTGQPQPG